MARGVGIFPGSGAGGSGSTGGTSGATAKRTQGGYGLLAGDSQDQVVRALLVSGLIRGRNLDGVLGNPEIWALNCPAVVGEATIRARGGVQQIVFEADILECDVYEMQCYDFQGTTPAALSALQGGIYTEPPQSNGTPYPDTAVVDWTQSYSAWAGTNRVLVVPTIRQRLQPVDFQWIPKTQPSTDFTFKVRLMAYCDWWKGSADPNPRVD